MFTRTANAAVVEAITNVIVSPTTIPEDGTIRADIVWSVPASAQGGDTFTLNFPSVVTMPPSGFELRDASNNLVATATSSGNTLTFTLSNFVNTHTNVNGTAYISSGIAGATAGTPENLTFTTSTQTFSATIDITPAYTDRSQVHKLGDWTKPDQGHVDPSEALAWYVIMPNTNWVGATIEDTAPNGTTIDCGSLWLVEADVHPTSGALSNIRPGPSGVAHIVHCDPTRFTATIDAHSDPTTVYAIGYTTSLDGPRRDLYTNIADVSGTVEGIFMSVSVTGHVGQMYGGTGDGDTNDGDSDDNSNASNTTDIDKLESVGKVNNISDNPALLAPNTGFGQSGTQVSHILVASAFVIAGITYMTMRYHYVKISVRNRR